MKSIITFILLSITLIIFSFSYYPKYQQGGSEATISWDVSGYYWYLPAVFIYKDLKGLNFTDSILNAYACSPDNQQITYLPDGKKVLKYSGGMALQYLPFFLLADRVAKPLGYPADGFSKPYQLSIHLGGLLVFIIGLWFLRKVLLFYFKDGTVSWVIFFLIIGTNYLNYAGIDIGMSHCWLFSWYCVLIYLSHQFYSHPKYSTAVIIGFIAGIMTLTRPTEIISVIIPLLLGVNLFSVDSIKERLLFLKNHFPKYLAAVIMMMLIGSIQLIYWKYVTGSWFVYSYGDQEFSWKHPHFYDYIFGYRCGWLRYCPMLILPYIGFIFLAKKNNIFWSLSIFSFCFLWIVCAWDIWWYGGRAMIQGYAVLMFPFASLIEYSNKKLLSRILLFGFAFFFLYMNLWWVHGVHKGGSIYSTDMSEAYYKKIAGKWKINEQDKKLLDVSEDFTGTKKQADTLLMINFDANGLHEIATDSGNYLLLKDEVEFEKVYGICSDLKSSEWIRTTAKIHCLKNNWDINRMTRFGLRFYKNERLIKENAILLDRLFYKELTQDIYVDAHIHSSKYDSLSVFIKNPKDAQGTFLMSHLLLEAFNE